MGSFILGNLLKIIPKSEMAAGATIQNGVLRTLKIENLSQEGSTPVGPYDRFENSIFAGQLK